MPFRRATPPTPTRYRDRQTGSIVVEHVPGQSLLRWFYTTSMGHFVFRAVFNRPLFSLTSTAGGSKPLGLGVKSALLSSATASISTKSNTPSATTPASTTSSFAASSPEPDPAIPTPNASVALPMAKSSSIRKSRPKTCYRSKATNSRPASS